MRLAVPLPRARADEGPTVSARNELLWPLSEFVFAEPDCPLHQPGCTNGQLSGKDKRTGSPDPLLQALGERPRRASLARPTAALARSGPSAGPRSQILSLTRELFRQRAAFAVLSLPGPADCVGSVAAWFPRNVSQRR